ncbi:hypothetical protein ACP4OV_011138 [Aristida adscensionis]
MPSSQNATHKATTESSRSPWRSARPRLRSTARGCRRSPTPDESIRSRRSRTLPLTRLARTVASYGSTPVFTEAQMVMTRASYYGESTTVPLQPRTAVVHSSGAMMAPSHSENRAAHISSERQRRERLSQHFIALAKIVPGLRKMDKASILSDAIRYLKQLQEQVKVLEEEARRWPDEAPVLAEKSSQPSAMDDDNVMSCKDDDSEGSVESRQTAALPEIKAHVLDRTVHVSIQCKNRKGAVVAALSELERIGVTIMTTNVLTFVTSLDITIVATAEEGFCLSVEHIVRRLNQALKI